MIGRIRGIIVEKNPPYLVIDVAGIAYEIAAPMTTFYELPDLQQTVTLFTHLMIREDAHLLYGFKSESDRRLFRTLIKVNGIGPKLALTILSGIDPLQFIHCVARNDVGQLLSIPGIGRKTAERLLMETKDVMASWHSTDTANLHPDLPEGAQERQDAINALVALGYKPKEAQLAIDRVQQPGCSREILIRSALKQMVTGQQ